MDATEPQESLVESGDSPIQLEELESSLSETHFRDWRREQQFRENIRDNNPEYNEGGYPTDINNHLPHQLKQCHRKVWYRERNAPQETPEPDGIFAIGSWIEEEIVAPWLEDVAESHGAYYANDLWLEATVETPHADQHFRGATDPAICDSDGRPLLLTEVKTKESLTKLDGPKDRHKAQLAAYQYAAGEEYDIEPPVGFVIYVGKKRFDLQTYRIEFDPDFFRWSVVEWAETMSEYRVEKRLPPAEPVENWECRLCEFQSRCGEDDNQWSDLEAQGLLPLIAYPRESVLDYLAAHDDPVLTPTIAHHYPKLAESFAVADWVCESCGETYAWDNVDWSGDVDTPPACDRCAANERYAELSGPVPVVRERKVS